MKRYLVKVHGKANEKNKSFKGAEVIHIFGKKEQMLLSYGKGYIPMNYNFFNGYSVKEYGYKRECDAKRSYFYKHPEEKYWDNEVSIICFEV